MATNPQELIKTFIFFNELPKKVKRQVQFSGPAFVTYLTLIRDL